MKKPKLALHWQILIGIALGAICGVFLPQYVHYVNWAGDIFLRALKMIVIPLVFSSIYMGVVGMGETRNFGRIAGKTMAYYISTTLVAILIGLVLVTIIKPGVGGTVSAASQAASEFTSTKVSMLDQIINIVPQNIFEDLASGDLLPIIAFAILFGIFTTKVDAKYQTSLRDIFQSVYEVIMKMTLFVLKFTPYGVFAIVANMVGKEMLNSGNLAGMAGSLGVFVLTVWSGILIQGLVILPLTVRFMGKENPWKHIRKMSVPLLTAFTTASSSAALPLSIRDSQANCGISAKISGFTLPLGSTINMNGTALFECVAAIFIANMYGIELTLSQEIIIVLTSLLAAVGSAGIPMAGLVMMTIVLNTVGLPLEGIGLIMAVNQLCEMPRTCLNVYGDLCGTVIIAKSEGEKLTIS